MSAHNRILIIRGGALGDFILTLPVLRGVRDAFPRAQIEILGYPAIARLAVEAGLAVKTHRVDAAALTPLFSGESPGPPSLVDWLRGFSVVVCVWHDPSAEIMHTLRGWGIPNVIHVEPIPPEGTRIHSSDYMLSQLPSEWRVSSSETRTLTVCAERREWARAYLRRHLGLKAARLIAVHPGSGGRGTNRNWPPDRFADVVTRISGLSNTSCLLIRGPADDESVRAVEKRLAPDRVPVASGLEPVQLAGLLAEITAVVSNDSGVAHLAAAIGARTVAIFGATDSTVWAPRGPAVSVLQALRRIEDITVEQVMAALRLD